MFESFILQESLLGSPKSRPPDITIIAIFNIIGGIIMLFASTICFHLREPGWLWHIPFRNCALAHRRRNHYNRQRDNCHRIVSLIAAHGLLK